MADAILDEKEKVSDKQSFLQSTNFLRTAVNSPEWKAQEKPFVNKGAKYLSFNDDLGIPYRVVVERDNKGLASKVTLAQEQMEGKYQDIKRCDIFFKPNFAKVRFERYDSPFVDRMLNTLEMKESRLGPKLYALEVDSSGNGTSQNLNYSVVFSDSSVGSSSDVHKYQEFFPEAVADFSSLVNKVHSFYREGRSEKYKPGWKARIKNLIPLGR